MSMNGYGLPFDFSHRMKKFEKEGNIEGYQETPEKRKKRLLLLVRSGIFHFLEELVREQKNLGITDDEIRENVFVGIEMRKHMIHDLHSTHPIFEKAILEYTLLEERLNQLSPKEILEENQNIIKKLTPK